MQILLVFEDWLESKNKNERAAGEARVRKFTDWLRGRSGDVTGLRNYTLMKLMLDTGFRRSKATRLRWEDVNLTSGKLAVTEGKG